MRRGKLTKAQRERRAAKREHRARDVIPRKRHRQELELRYRDAWRQYAIACISALREPGERCVCERCRLEQERGEGQIFEDGSVTVAPCENCGHEYAETVEAFL